MHLLYVGSYKDHWMFQIELLFICTENEYMYSAHVANWPDTYGIPASYSSGTYLLCLEDDIIQDSCFCVIHQHLISILKTNETIDILY